MQRLTDGHEIHARFVQPGLFGFRNAVRHPGMSLRVRDLVRARVRGDDLGEMLGEAAGCLPAPGAGVPAEGVPRDERGDGVEELRWIRGAVAGVVARVAREVILEDGRAQMTQISSRR
jgi:hypothetical protein